MGALAPILLALETEYSVQQVVMRIRKALALTFFLLLVACPAKQQQESVFPDPPHPAEDVEYCALAEQNLLRLKCKDSSGALLGGPNRRGVSFDRVCMDAQENMVDLNPRCLSEAENCEAVLKCSP